MELIQRHLVGKITILLIFISLMGYSQTIKLYGVRMYQMGATPVDMNSIKKRYTYYADIFDKKTYDNIYSRINKNNQVNTGLEFNADKHIDAAVIRIDFTDDSCNNSNEICNIVVYESGKFKSTDGKLYPLKRNLYKQIKKLIPECSRPHMLMKWASYKKKLNIK